MDVLFQRLCWIPFLNSKVFFNLSFASFSHFLILITLLASSDALIFTQNETSASALQGHEISNLRIFLEEIAKEKGFDPLDIHSWESIGNAEINKRVCIGFILTRALVLTKYLKGGSYMLKRRGGLTTVIKKVFPEAVLAQ